MIASSSFQTSNRSKRRNKWRYVYVECHARRDEKRSIVIADLKGKLRVERKKSRVLQMRLLQKHRWRDGGDGEGHFVIATNISVVNCAFQ